MEGVEKAPPFFPVEGIAERGTEGAGQEEEGEEGRDEERETPVLRPPEGKEGKGQERDVGKGLEEAGLEGEGVRHHGRPLPAPGVIGLPEKRELYFLELPFLFPEKGGDGKIKPFQDKDNPSGEGEARGIQGEIKIKDERDEDRGKKMHRPPCQGGLGLLVQEEVLRRGAFPEKRKVPPVEAEEEVVREPFPEKMGEKRKREEKDRVEEARVLLKEI